MSQFNRKFIKIMCWLGILIADFMVYLILALLLMGYEDSWNGSKGAMWSLESMDASEKALYILYIGWYVINFVFVIFFLRKLYPKLNKRI